ncbi:MAG: hypothetical protein KDC69_09490 [Flavobacteriaceae bacterium]|nr:hypothetical protein [Flavobacteriaceae bacterium]
MKKIFLSIFVITIFQLSSIAQGIAPYIKVGESTESIQQVTEKVVQALKDNSFTALGTYNPENKSTLKVIAFTNNKLKSTVVKVTDRGALAAAMRIGLVEKNGKTIISYTNPEYILRAYLRDNYNTYKTTFEQFGNDVKKALENVGSEFSPFGGSVKADELKKYHYKIMMPYFTDPVELNTFNSFDEGLSVIEKNLAAKKGNTLQVYKIVYPEQKVAVFGVGLLNKEEGEPHFLPKIGEEHIAALPYEIILQGKEATMLHGKYRIALFWPDLTMGTFMKIMSTPGDIEDALEALCK